MAEIARKGAPTLDMTPMVDLAFLLVTFFMLTTQFRPEEAQQVNIPSSTTESQITESNNMTITVAPDGRIFFDMDNKYKRKELIERMNEEKGLGLNEDQMNNFALLQSFGFPFSQLGGYLGLEASERSKLTNRQPGIPADSTNNQLKDWIVYARAVNPKLRIFVKGDSQANYENIKNVMETLQSKPFPVNRFNLLTSAEGGAAAEAVEATGL